MGIVLVSRPVGQTPYRTIRRWQRISALAHMLDRLFEAQARLDAYQTDDTSTAGRLNAPWNLACDVDRRIKRLHGRLEKQLDAMTVELLDARHARRVRKDRSHAA